MNNVLKTRLEKEILKSGRVNLVMKNNNKKIKFDSDLFKQAIKFIKNKFNTDNKYAENTLKLYLARLNEGKKASDNALKQVVSNNFNLHDFIEVN